MRRRTINLGPGLYGALAALVGALVLLGLLLPGVFGGVLGLLSDWVALLVTFALLLGSAPWGRVPPFAALGTLHDWIINVPALAGQRGLLLGAALGAIATSLRILLGFDRPYLN